MLLLLACTEDSEPPPDDLPTLGETVVEVPAAGLPVEPNVANNNLAVLDVDGRTFLAWRSADSHFAGPEVVMHVISREADGAWEFEATLALGTDVREPQLVVIDGALRLYFAVLGTNSSDFEPQGSQMITRLGPGQWSEPVDVFEPTFIAWRIREVAGGIYAIGYAGGENIYDVDGEPIEVMWLTTEDGVSWVAVVPDQPIVHSGGASETDWLWLRDGGVLAVMRNESGEGNDFGAFVCRAPADDLGTWNCQADPRKYDSPLLFEEGGRYWLVGRRTLGADGLFDLGQDELSPKEQYTTNQVSYWADPKRCALWEVDPDALAVEWVLDLPSAGDTCFPHDRQLGDGVHEIWNYTSPLDGRDPSWLEGQNGPTQIVRTAILFGG